jgi:ribosomal protein S18 acetylase RimI-like enzyme
MEGVVGWLPGRRADINTLRALLSGAALPSMLAGMDMMRRMMPIATTLQSNRKKRMAGREYRYLQMIGVATRHQGAGLGSSMVRALAGRCDREAAWLYLETATERNARFYERFGFRLLDKIVLPQIDLPMWELARAPGAKMAG